MDTFKNYGLKIILWNCILQRILSIVSKGLAELLLWSCSSSVQKSVYALKPLRLLSFLTEPSFLLFKKILQNLSFRSEPCLNQTRNQIKNHGTSSAIPFETTKSLVLSKKRLKTSFLQSTYQLLNQARTKAETKSKAIEPVLQDHRELCEKDQSQNQT